jgi:16S rRNA (guanine1207-N2)-methyltransferase
MKSPIKYSPYEEPQVLTARLRDSDVSFVSKPGLPLWNQISASASLLADTVDISLGGRLLMLGCGHGACAAALARQFPKSELWLLDTNYIAIQMCLQTLRANQVDNAYVLQEISVPPHLAGSFEVVTLDLPKGRGLARRWLAEAWTALRAGGHLYLVGANSQGIHSAAKDAQALFGNTSVLAYKKGNRVIRSTKMLESFPNVGWMHEAGIAPGTWHEFSIESPRGALDLCSLPGVFSFDRLDEGTQLLLSGLGELHAQTVLDLGCGYGVIGLLAAMTGAAQVDLVDANLLAVASAEENLTRYKAANAGAFPSDVLSAVKGKKYALILSNPPFHSGQTVDYQITQAFIHQSYQALEAGGQLWMVANKFIRYDRIMQTVFGNVCGMVETNRFHIIASEKRS